MYIVEYRQTVTKYIIGVYKLAIMDKVLRPCKGNPPLSRTNFNAGFEAFSRESNFTMETFGIKLAPTNNNILQAHGIVPIAMKYVRVIHTTNLNILTGLVVRIPGHF